MREIMFGLAVMGLSVLAGCAHQSRQVAAKDQGPWDMKPIESAPLNVQFGATEEKVVDGVKIIKHEVYYDSLNYQGKVVRIYGWYGYPASASAQQKAPALVWAHGGGGRTAPGEIDYFAPKGYAMLTIDLPGKGDGRAESRSTGPDMNDKYLMYLPANEADLANSYIYQSAIALMRGVTFLQQRPEVKGDAIGAIGWSWGGLIVATLNAHDPRIKAAAPGVPVAGRVRNRPANMSDEEWTKLSLWRTSFDPLALEAKMLHPVFVVTGSNDNIPAHSELFNGLTVEKRMYAVPNGGHGGGNNDLWKQYTWYDQLIHWFDWQLKGQAAMPQFGQVTMKRQGDAVQVTGAIASDPTKISAAEIWYQVRTAQDQQAHGRGGTWEKVAARQDGRTFSAEIRRGGSIRAYALIRDDRGAMVSSPVMAE